MLTFLKEYWAELGISTFGLMAAAYFLVKHWAKNAVEHNFNLRLEQHKEELRSQTEIQLTKLRANLEIAAAERNFRFSHVFEKTATAIATTYEKVVALNRSLQSYSGWATQPQKEKITEEIQTRWDQFLEYYAPNKIYIPKRTREKIRHFTGTARSVSAAIERVFHLEAQQTNEDDVMQGESRIIELQERIAELQRSLEDDFQSVLGFPLDGEVERPSKAEESSGSDKR